MIVCQTRPEGGYLRYRASVGGEIIKHDGEDQVFDDPADAIRAADDEVIRVLGASASEASATHYFSGG